MESNYLKRRGKLRANWTSIGDSDSKHFKKFTNLFHS